MDKIFDRNEEKKRIKVDIESSCLVFISGLRRVGKTTLVRSIANSVKNSITVYINFWNQKFANSQDMMNFMVSDLVIKLKEKKSLLRRIGAEFRGAELIIGPLKFRFERSEIENLLLLLDNIIKEDIRTILILDEIQECNFNRRELAKFVTALKDRYTPNIAIFLMGSISSVGDFLGTGEEVDYAYGRKDDEMIIKPFDNLTAEEFLVRGFEECEIEVNGEDIKYAVARVGGFPGGL